MSSMFSLDTIRRFLHQVTNPPRRMIASRRRFAPRGEGLESRELMTASQAIYGLTGAGNQVTILNPSTGKMTTYAGGLYLRQRSRRREPR
jgi:hypothetical protein